jgi:undecaprenyl diphosphate synthase
MNRVKHIGIIPDGGRRWAKREGRSLADSYELSSRRIVDFLRLCQQGEIAETSVYIMSKANLLRTEEELTSLYPAIITLCEHLLDPSSLGIFGHIRIIGNWDLLPGVVKKSLHNLLRSNIFKGNLSINLLLAYDGWDEINAAFQRKKKTISIDDLWIKKEIHAVIRTGGSALLSGFLPMQCQYAHIFKFDKFFNDLSDTDVEMVIKKTHTIEHLCGK